MKNLVPGRRNFLCAILSRPYRGSYRLGITIKKQSLLFVTRRYLLHRTPPRSPRDSIIITRSWFFSNGTYRTTTRCFLVLVLSSLQTCRRLYRGRSSNPSRFNRENCWYRSRPSREHVDRGKRSRITLIMEFCRGRKEPPWRFDGV